MNSFVASILAFIALYAVAVILSHLKPLKIKLIANVTSKMEIKYQCCEKSGAKKKANAIKILRWILIRIDSGTSLLIDAIVNVANDKKGDVAASLKSVTMAEVNTQLAKLRWSADIEDGE